MAAKLLRNAMSWLESLFHPPVIALTLVLMVLLTILAVDLTAWLIVLDK